MLFRDPLNDRQPQSCSLFTCGHVGVKKVISVPFWQSAAIICNLDSIFIGSAFQSNVDTTLIGLEQSFFLIDATDCFRGIFYNINKSLRDKSLVTKGNNGFSGS